MNKWTNAGLERLLASAVERSVPDFCAQLANASIKMEHAAVDSVPMPGVRKSAVIRRGLAGLCACLTLLLGLGTYAFFHSASTIGIDVNPRFELEANRFDRVLSVRALNADAEVVLRDLRLKYLDLGTAVNALVGSMALHGYLGDGERVEVLVSVTGGSGDRVRALQKRLTGDIEQAAVTVGASVLVCTQDGREDFVSPSGPDAFRPADRQSGDPLVGREQKLIDRLLVLAPSLDEKALAAMSVGELAALIRQLGLDPSQLMEYDPDDSLEENIEDFMEEQDDDDDDDFDDDGPDQDDD